VPLFEADLTGLLHDGDEVTLDFDKFQVVVSDGTVHRLTPPPPFVREIWRVGSVVEFYRRYGKLPGQD